MSEFSPQKWSFPSWKVTLLRWQCHQHQLNSGSLVSLTNPTKALKISSSLLCPFNDKMVSSSSLDFLSSKTILMKTHNCATSTISVDSWNGMEKYSRASTNFFSCSSTAFPSHCLVEVLWESCTFLWPSLSVFHCWSFQKGYLLLWERLPWQISPSSNGFLCLARTWLIWQEAIVASLPCVLSLVKTECCAASCAFKSQIFVAHKDVLAGKSL